MLTQVVARDRLVEAHAKNALASSGAEVAGPGLAGALIKLVGAPLALLRRRACCCSRSALILRGIDVHEVRAPQPRLALLARPEGRACASSRGTRCWSRWRCAVGVWQMCHHAAIVVQILFATRTLGLSEQAVGLSYVGLGVGTVLASVLGNRISRAHRPGPVPGARLRDLRRGLAAAGASRRPTRWGVAAFALMLMLFGIGAVLIFINFLALRQAVTPAPLLGRMTSTMRWLILHPGRARARCSAAGSASTSACARRWPSPAAARCCWRCWRGG